MRIANKDKSDWFPDVSFCDLVAGNVYLGRLNREQTRDYFLATDEDGVVRLCSGVIFGRSFDRLYECEYIPSAFLDW